MVEVELSWKNERASKLEYSFGCSCLTTGLTEAVGKKKNLLNGRFGLRSHSMTKSADKMTELVAMHLFDDEHAKPTSSK